MLDAMAGCGAVGGILLARPPAKCSPRPCRRGVESWGWRVPFITGLVVRLRRVICSEDIFANRRSATQRSPVRRTFRSHGALLARLAGLAAFNAVGFYLLFVLS